VTVLPRVRAGLWSLRAVRVARRELRRNGLDGRVALPAPPPVPASAVGGVKRALRLTRATCLVRTSVLQAWHAGHGWERELVVAVPPPGEGFAAHAWLDGDDPGEGRDFTVLLRRAPVVAGGQVRTTARTRRSASAR
jgi:hypothetical protein